MRSLTPPSLPPQPFLYLNECGQKYCVTDEDHGLIIQVVQQQTCDCRAAFTIKLVIILELSIICPLLAPSNTWNRNPGRWINDEKVIHILNAFYFEATVAVSPEFDLERIRRRRFLVDALQDLGIFAPFHPVKVGISNLKSVISGSQRGRTLSLVI